MRAEGPCIIGGEYPDSRFSTQQGKKLNKNKEGGNSQPSKQQEKRTTDTISFIVVAIVSHALPGTNVHWLNPCI